MHTQNPDDPIVRKRVALQVRQAVLPVQVAQVYWHAMQGIPI